MSPAVSLVCQRAHAAALAERHALAVLGGNRDAIGGLRFYAHMKDVLDQQIAWEGRRTAWVWPVVPAWVD